MDAPAASCEHGQGMNVLIPIGGSGLRFAQAGLSMPKPMLKLAGRPMLSWVLDSLNLTAADTIFVGLSHELESKYRVVSRLQNQYPHLDIRCVDVRFKTRGAAETLFILLQRMSALELTRKTLSVDCHTLFRSDVLTQFRALPEGLSCSFYFDDDGAEPLYSYIRLDDNGRIVSVREKQAISTLANTGAYGFCSGAMLKGFCAHAVNQSLPAEDESHAYYVSALITRMLEHGHPFQGIRAELLSTINNPTKMNAFLDRLGHNPQLDQRKMRIVFNLDNTLVTLPADPADYSSVRPVADMVDLCHELKAAGHTIIVYTDRGMRAPGACSPTSPSSQRATVSPAGASPGVTPPSPTVTAAVAAQRERERVEATLARFDVPYDELYFGKPVADVVVDDCSVNPLGGHVRRDIGWRQTCSDSGDGSMVSARAFNLIGSAGHADVGVIEAWRLIEVHDDAVHKTALRPVLEGEVFFYRNAPPGIAHLFPALRSAVVVDPPAQCILRMDRVRGVTFTHLLVNRCVTRHRLTLLLDALRQVHLSEGMPGDVDEGAADALIYRNYATKVQARYDQHRDMYQMLMTTAEDADVPHTIIEYLRRYEADGRAEFTHVQHGDPVFSNVLLQGDDRVVFLDMRGCLGDQLTLVGDMAYDLAKVFQSLHGYDYLILDQPVLASDSEILADLQQCFFDYVAKHYPRICKDDIRMITASHFLSLIPLHPEASANRKMLFWTHCKALLLHPCT